MSDAFFFLEKNINFQFEEKKVLLNKTPQKESCRKHQIIEKNKHQVILFAVLYALYIYYKKKVTPSLELLDILFQNFNKELFFFI